MYKFQTLIVWQKGNFLVKNILKIVEYFPKKYKYSLTEQLIRSSLSITNNIAEGCGRVTKKDKRYFFVVAQGSLLEVVNMLLLVKDLCIIKEKEVGELLNLTEEISKMLYVIINK